MEHINEVVLQLKGKLQDFVNNHLQKHSHTSDNIPWSWVCMKLLNLLSNYPSGVTEAVILSELHRQLIKTKMWQTSSTSCSPCGDWTSTYCNLCEVLDLKTVSSESVAEVKVASVHCIPGTTTKILHVTDFEEDSRYIEMYLHRKFYDLVDLLKTHTLRMTGLHLVNGPGQTGLSSGKTSSLRLLPTEHVVVVMEMGVDSELLRRFEPLKAIFDTCCITQPEYIQSTFAKVVSVGSEEAVHSSDGTTYRRLVVELDVSHDGGVCVPLVLWDSYIQFARLFDKGDLLYMDHPYAKPCGVGGASEQPLPFCLEYGPATTLYLVPYVPQMEVVSQHPRTELPISVHRTEEGKLDFLCYPERLLVSDVVPGMVNAVMMLQCEQWVEEGEGGKEERMGEEGISVHSLHASDHTGVVVVQVHGLGADTHCQVYPSQIIVISGLSYQDNGDMGVPHLLCDLAHGATIINVSSLRGWLLSPTLCSHLPLGEVTPTDLHFTTVATLQEWTSQEGCGQEVWHPHSPGYRLSVSFGDGVASLRADLTCVAAQSLLQRSVTEFLQLSSQEKCEIFSSLIGVEMTSSISQVTSGRYQADCIALSKLS